MAHSLTSQALALALAAGAAAHLHAQASEIDPLPIGPAQHVGPPFSDRALITVYGSGFNDCPSSAFAIGNGSSYVMEDVSFSPGPYGSTSLSSREITQVGAMFQTAGWTGTPIFPSTTVPQFFITQVFEFWDAGSFTAAPMLSAATPFATRSIQTNFGSGYTWPYNALLNPVVDAGTRVNIWVAIRAIDPSTGARIYDGNTALQQPTGQTGVSYGVWLGRVGDACVGHTEPDYGRDQNPTSVFGGEFSGGANYLVGSAPGNANDRRRTSTDPTLARILTLELWGECQGIDCGDIPPPESICPVPDGLTTRAIALVADDYVKWYRLCLSAPATDSDLRYLSMDTEGSQQAMALGLYRDDGALLATDDGSGSGTNSQLTFGVGRSAGVGNGAQYDGRDGELPAGTYYLAIAGSGSQFGSAFGVTAAVHGAEPVTLNIRTNANGGGNLPPVVTPAINHADFTLGPAWTFPAEDTLQGTAGPSLPDPNGDTSSAVLWSRFTIPSPGATDLGLDTTYLDIDAGASTQADNLLYLFNETGDLIAVSDDQIPGVAMLPLMSFGASNPQRSPANGQVRGANNASNALWMGQTGALPPGTYYAASAAWPSDVLTGQGGNLPIPGPGRRFHVRGLSGNNTPQTLRFYTGGGFNCDPTDFNGDGLFPDTLDIDDFLSVFSGGVCSTGTCADVDFNNDGLFPDTLDIDAFLIVFSGGGCVR